jgi:malate synthase
MSTNASVANYHHAAAAAAAVADGVDRPTLTAPVVPGQEAVLGTEVLALLRDLHLRFEPQRQARLAARKAKQARFDAGELPDFRADTRAIRESDWTVAPLPKALLDRRVEITGPAEPKMVINALNSGARVYMADFEDSITPTWGSLIAGQRALSGAVRGDLEWTSPEGKHYALKREGLAVLKVRPRGWHLDERHVLIDGAPIAGGLFDLGVFIFNNAHALVARDRGPYAYLPKLECMEEAALWDEVLAFLEVRLGLPIGTIKATVLIETLPAVFEMHEILHALRSRAAGLNCGRWDYIFSYLKTFRAHPDRVLPERAQVGMTQPFLKAYSELLIQTCHRRGAHAMGGMAAQIPISVDPVANEAALARVRADKLREVGAGHDGTWVAHPALVPLAQAVFDEHMPTPNQYHVLRQDVQVTRDQLIAPCAGTITRAGFENNVEVCVRYLAAWFDGQGCVPIHWLMEDAATAEISRTQLWQWLHHERLSGNSLYLDDGSAIDFSLFESALLSLPSKLAEFAKAPGGGRIDDAIALLDELTHADTLTDFLTLPAYQRLC